MEQPAQTRSQALRALRALIRVPRLTEEDPLVEFFPFGIVPPGLFDGKPLRRPEDDRGIVLMMGAVLDQALESALLAKLSGVKEGNEDYLFSTTARLFGT